MTQAPPKPFKKLTQAEFDRCIVKSGFHEIEIRRLIGYPAVPRRKQTKPEDFTMQQARAVRMLAVYPEFRDRIRTLLKDFPRLRIDAIRPLPDAGKNATK